MTNITRRATLSLALLPFLPRMAVAAQESVRLRELYNRDMSFSDLALELEGKRVTIDGFMAPPLRAESDFFVLTNIPMAICPFCSSEAEWPNDIMAVYTKRQVRVISFNAPIAVNGVLELGTYTDPELGFVSRVRLMDAEYGRR
ncbi:hypothetical protein [Paracoccus sp. (in: a-proteobacteria)]|uniref:hypothetical protein n=1 Tax=Paracoccus sp. TaxID=267 RepID=UPI0026DFBB9F|nr:hypothetical protein [Paracoccus sp. (in: a-proteobacteria)]MDO5646612.1 hypothetical protein [Paracoccus sp. (in: a-proteobacteria)]